MWFIHVNYNGHSVEPIHIFLSGSEGTGKSHLVKLIYNTIPKTLLYHCKDPEKPSSFNWAFRNISGKYR